MYLNFDGVTKRYGSVVAVHNTTFTVDRGEFVSLLGPSGCGKTTTLMLLAGFETPDAGQIVLDGRNLTGIPPEKRSVGVVFQHYALFPHMNVADNIAFGLVHGNNNNLSRPAIKQRVTELLEMIDLAPLANRKPAELSAGQQQRVAIARSLAPHPQVLCFDEPLSALDALLREKLRLEIRRLQRELGLTVLYVTHDQEEALAISDRVVVMSGGEIVQIGSPWDVYDKPNSEFAAGFIGKGSLLAGKLISISDSLDIELLGGQVVRVPRSTWCGLVEPQQGASIRVVLRAERAAILTGTADTLGNNSLALPGQLVEVEFLGGLLRLHIKGLTGTLTVAVPAVNSYSWQTRIGTEVVVSYCPDDVRLVPAKTSDAVNDAAV